MTLTDFKQHILRRLGSPVINIELADEQMDIYIEDTVDSFIETHYDGLDLGFIFLNTIVDQSEYILDSTIHSVLEVNGVSTNVLNDEPLLINPYTVGDVETFSTDILDLTMFRQSISLYSTWIEDSKRFEFNSTDHTLTLLEVPKTVEKIALKVHRSPANLEDIYNNDWVKKYATCLCKIAWAANISKFEGATLPGGVSLNYSQILSEAKEEKAELEEELYERYQEPIDPMWG